MNPAAQNDVRHSFIVAVKEMDPTDAIIMDHMYSVKVTRIRVGGGAGKQDTSVEFISKELGYRQDDVAVSIKNLEALGFLFTAPNDNNLWVPSPKFREFMQACYPELEA